MALLLPRCTEYPYKSWKLRCVDEEKAIMDIETKRLSLSFEIGPNYAMLIERKEPEFAHLINKQFSPGYLLIELARCGVLLMPKDDDTKQGEIELKDKYTEENAIIDIATTLRAFAYRSAKWNTPSDSQNIIVKQRENLEYDREFFEDHEPDWRYIMWWPNKCAYVRTSDALEELDSRLAQEQVTHAMLNLAVKGVVSEDAHDRCYQYSYIEFIDTVKKMLRLTRILSFT